MTISSFEALGVRFQLSLEKEIANISAPGPQIKKVRTLWFLKLEKLKKRKWPYFFLFVAQERRYDHFFFWRSGCKVRAIVSGRNCQYLDSWATNQKSKDTLLSQTLKVEEKKETLVFLICDPEAEICPLYHFSCISLWCDPLKKGESIGSTSKSPRTLKFCMVSI